MALITTSKGKYGKGTLKESSMVENALQKPQIYSQMIRLKHQYGFTYFTEGTGRVRTVPTKQEEWGNNSFEWFIKGRSDRPDVVAGVPIEGDGTSSFTLPLVNSWLNKTEVVKLHSGKMAIVKEDASGTGPYFYKFQIISVDESGVPYNLDALVDCPVGSQISIYSNLNQEKSEKGYSTLSYPDKYIQYMGTQRRSLDVTGQALGNVIWVTNTKNKQGLWYFEAEDEVDKQMLRHMDLWRMYGENTINANGVPFITMDGKPVYAGDGVLTQLSGINEYQFSSDASVNRSTLSDFIAMLATKSNDFDNNHWVLLCGARAMTVWHKYFENSLIDKGNFAYSYFSGKEIEVGGNYASYRMGTNTISLVRIAAFDDEHLHSVRDVNNHLLESSRMVYMNYGKINNDTNVIIAVRQSINGNRGLIKRYEKGMVDPFNIKQTSEAFSGVDGFSVHWLSESGAVVTNPFCCGQWVRTA